MQFSEVERVMRRTTYGRRILEEQHLQIQAQMSSKQPFHLAIN